MRAKRRRIVLSLPLMLLALTAPVSVVAQQARPEEPTPRAVATIQRDKPVSFTLEVSEILFDRCAGCHGSALTEGDLNLEEYETLMAGGNSGPVVVPGKAEESLLFLLAAHRQTPVMPPDDQEAAKPLSAEELGLLKLWIDAGARDDTAEVLAEMEASDAARKQEGEALALGPLPPGVQPIVAVDVTQDGRLVAAGRANVVHLYEVATGEEVARLEGHQDIIQSLRFSPDGSRLAAGGYRVVKLWKATDEPGGWVLEREFGPHAFRVLALDFRPDGQWLATGGGVPSQSGEVKLWEVETGRLVLELGELHSDTVFSVRFRPDGRALATASADRLVKVVELPDGAASRTFEGHTHHVLAVDWNADGTQLVSGGADNVLKVWDTEEGTQLRTSQEADKQVTALRWVPGKPVVAAASGDRTVQIWNPEDGKIVRRFTGAGDYIFGVATSGDGKVVAAGGADGVLWLWDDSGKVLRSVAPAAGDSSDETAAAG